MNNSIFCRLPEWKRLVEKLAVTGILLVAVSVMYALKIPCIILTLTGHECAGCGMTRALMSAVRLDFAGAFSYHGMFWSVPILYIFFVFDGRVFKKRWMNTAVLALIAAGFLANYVEPLRYMLTTVVFM